MMLLIPSIKGILLDGMDVFSQKNEDKYAERVIYVTELFRHQILPLSLNIKEPFITAYDLFGIHINEI